MTTQMLFAVLTIQHEMTDNRARVIIDKAMANGDYAVTSKGFIVRNTNSGMPAEFRIEEF